MKDSFIEGLQTVIEAIQEEYITEAGKRHFFKAEFSKLEKHRRPQNTYSLWINYLFMHFERCIIQPLETKAERVIIRNAFTFYRKNSPYQ